MKNFASTLIVAAYIAIVVAAAISLFIHSIIALLLIVAVAICVYMITKKKIQKKERNDDIKTQ